MTNRIEMPLPLIILSHVGGALRSDLSSEDETKPVDPEPDAFMTNIDPTLVEQVFNIAKREREADIHQHSKLDDLGGGFDIAKRIFAHPVRLNRFRVAGQVAFR